jgi:hypothetical protein
MSWFKKWMCSWFHIGCPDSNPVTTSTTTPATTTETTTLPPPPPISNDVYIFCETGAADSFDWFTKQIRRSVNEIYVCSIKGKSRYGRTMRLIHPWYDPCKTPIDIESFVKQAFNEQCYGISLDYEGWTIAEGPNWLKKLYETCQKYGMKLCIVPKINFEHLARDWKTMSYAEVEAWVNKYSDVSLEWQYETTAAQYNLSFQDNYFKQQVPMFDGTGDRYLSLATRQQYIREARALGYGIGIFLPKDDKLIPAIN